MNSLNRRFALFFCRSVNISGTFYVLSLLCLVASNVVSAETLNALELLDRYAANQNKIKSLIAKTEVAWIPSTEGIQDQKPRQSRSIVEFRYEHSGKDFKAYTCRTSFNLDDNGIWVEEKSRSKKYLWHDKRYYQYYRGPRLEVSKLYISSDPKFAGDKEPPATEMPWDGVGPFRGILSYDAERIDSILRKSDSLSVRSALERVGSVDCYVIDAKSKHGTYAIWLDPEHGYGIAKAIVRKGPEDYIRGRPRSNYIINPIDNYTDVTENVRFECVDGIWFPMEFELSSTTESKNETLSGCTQYKVVYLDVNPDHNAPGSFRLDRLDIQDGTRVKIAEAPGIRYTWQDGKIIPDVDEYVIEQIDKMTEEIMTEGEVHYEPATDKKTDISRDETATTGDAQADTAESQQEVLSESRPFPVLVLIPIGLLIIVVSGWLVFRRIKA